MPTPLVFTGGMRPATSVSADGPANLLDACRVASAADAAGAGVLVVLNGTVHRAVAARKRHSWMLNAFSSGDAGPWGHVVENELRRRGEASAVRPKVGEPQRRVNVPLLHTFLGDEGETLDVVMGSAPDGVVIGAFGVGHVSAGMANRINAATRQCPVVVASRTGAGGTHAGTYDFVGSETDLGRRGARLSSLDPFKARLLLWALLAAGAEVSEWPPL